ncbi:hypothetical protein NLU13_0212 [Sarocladium strictum]|uniref:Uncharacterized protein n=1 Tax=Sarocladium strictum TaxID=5046 RepID=A0AA39LBA8_SARSR|nr:hypothetical protein NLU13_0212 [Sarocladium strictum]
MDSFAPPPSLAWRRSSTEQGVWERGTDEVEDAYATWEILYESTTGMFFAITGHISLTFPKLDGASSDAGSAIDDAIRKAWTALRYDHPTIASETVVRSDGQFSKVYKTLETGDELQEWLDRTVVDATGFETGADFANSRPPSPTSPTLFVVSTPSKQGQLRRDIVLRSPHSIIDGIGTLLLLGNLVTYIRRAIEEDSSFAPPALDGSETQNLSPPYRSAAGLPATPSEMVQRRLAELAAPAASGEDKSKPRTLAIPYRSGSMEPGVPKRTALMFSEEETSVLRQRCRDLQATPTHAFHAAIPLAIRDLQARGQGEQTVRYTGYILRNERASCREPYNTAQHPATLYHSTSSSGLHIDVTLPAAGSADPDVKSEFSRILVRMRDYYHSVRDDAGHAMLVPYLWKNITKPSSAYKNRPCPIPPPDESPSVSISSMGELDRVIPPDQGVVRVYDPWVTGEELRSGLGLFLGTYRGELCLSAVYNEAWQSEEGTREFLEACKRIVLGGLGI